MISDRALAGILKALYELMPPECQFALVAIEARPITTPDGRDGLDCDVKAAGLVEGPESLKLAVGAALQALGADICADAQASDEPG